MVPSALVPARMRLVVLPISTFGAIGTPGHAFIGELSRRMRASVPYFLLPHASWATPRPSPRLSPMIRIGHSPSCRVGGYVRMMAIALTQRIGQ